MFENIRYLYLLNKYIKCNFGGQRCGTSTIVDIRHLIFSETFFKAKGKSVPLQVGGAQKVKVPRLRGPGWW